MRGSCGSVKLTAPRSVFRGAKKIRPLNARFLRLEEAKDYIQNCGENLKTTSEYRLWCASGRRPQHIPSNPDLAYAGHGWKGFADFLGNEKAKLRVAQSSERPKCQHTARARRAAMVRRSAAQECLMNELESGLPDFDMLCFSASWPSMILLRKKQNEDSDCAETPDAWIAVQMKFASASSKYCENHGKFVYQDVLRHDDVGLLFVCDEAKSLLPKRVSELPNRPGSLEKFSTLSFDLPDFDLPSLRATLTDWSRVELWFGEGA
eukprot:g10647.t1